MLCYTNDKMYCIVICGDLCLDVQYHNGRTVLACNVTVAPFYKGCNTICTLSDAGDIEWDPTQCVLLVAYIRDYKLSDDNPLGNILQYHMQPCRRPTWITLCATTEQRILEYLRQLLY